MKMIDMKLKKKGKSELKTSEAPISTSQEEYPYGLRLRLDSEQLEKMPHLKKMEVKDEIQVQGMGRVVSVSMNKSMDGKEQYNVEIQIEKLSCDPMESDNEEEDTIASEKKDALRYM